MYHKRAAGTLVFQLTGSGLQDLNGLLTFFKSFKLLQGANCC